MRITVRMPAFVVDPETDEQIEDPELLALLHGWTYNEDSLYYYIDDPELVDLGVVGGVISADWQAGAGLHVVVDFWAPSKLNGAQCNWLAQFVVGQLEDGIGEGGFDVDMGTCRVLLMADTDQQCTLHQYDDGVQVPLPPRIPRAARNGDLEEVKRAIQDGDPLDSTLQGYSGLHWAIKYGSVDISSILIKAGADVNAQDPMGNTPLHLCAIARALADADRVRIAQALLEHGADRSRKCSSGLTAEELAENRGKHELLHVLRTYPDRKWA